MSNLSNILESQKVETLEELIAPSVYSFLLDFNSNLIESAYIPQPAEWAAENRYLPSSVSDNYGQWDPDMVPAYVEILNQVHPDNPATHITVMKSVQSGLTVSFGENAMGFFTRYRLGSVLFFTSTKDVVKSRSNSALDIMIDNSGLDDLLKPSSNRTNRKSADTAFAKEFAGGIRWKLTSYGSMASAKSDSFTLIICDELEESEEELKGQGSFEGVIEGRTMAARMFKVLKISTSAEMETSKIYKSFIEGDQNRFFIPCPHCGGKQHLEFAFTKDTHGLTFDMRKNPDTGAKELDVTTVRYVCKHCAKPFREYQKNSAALQGEWIPTWKETEFVPKSPNHKSYHIPGLLSPFLAWARICQEYINTNFGKDILKFKNFYINYLGLPWAKVEKIESWQHFKKRAQDYVLSSNVAPEGVHRIYGSVDVQKDRLELGVFGVGKGLEKWFLDYHVFYGDPSRLDDICWTNMTHYIASSKFDTSSGKTPISMVAIDTGYDPRASAKREKDWDSKSHIVYDYIATIGRRSGILMIPIKGAPIAKGSDLIKTMKTSHSVITKRFDITVDMMKEMIASSLIIEDGAGAIHFPKWAMIGGIKQVTPDDIFKMFLSERYQEIKPGKMGWKTIRDRNEIWDLAVYASACMYIDDLHTWDDSLWDVFIKSKKKGLSGK